MITINKYRVNKLIPLATEIIKSTDFKEKKIPENSIPKEYNGYISSFNANCIIMTPLAVSIMYNAGSGSSEDKSKITKWIFDVLKKENASFTSKTNLVEYIEANSTDGKLNHTALINILTAGSALKLAIRKFKLV